MQHLKVEIEPSILSADFARLGEAAKEAEAAGVSGIQIDVMDGRFVPNINFGPGVVAALRPLVNITLDVHLMIIEPERYLETFAKAGADRIIVRQAQSECQYPVHQAFFLDSEFSLIDCG